MCDSLFIETGDAMPEQSEERTRISALFKRLDEQPRVVFPAQVKLIKELVPTTHGVYVIRAADGKVLHVGRTVSGIDGLAQRLCDHVKGKSSFVRTHLDCQGKVLPSNYTFQYSEVENDRERALLEHYAIAWHCPAHLGLGRKPSNE